MSKGKSSWLAEHATRYVHLQLHEKCLLTLLSSAAAAYNPSRADLVATVGELTGEGALRRLYSQVYATDEGRRLLYHKPRITQAVLQEARECIDGSLGHAYAAFMDQRSFDPSDRPAVRFVHDPELAYIACRAREAHDFWHVLTGCGTSVDGELALKAFEFANTAMPVGLLSLAASTRVPRSKQHNLFTQLIPWGLRAGTAAAVLPAVWFEQRLHQPLDGLRSELNIVPLA